MKASALTALIVSLALSAPAIAAGDAQAGQSKSATCAGCHGADGNSTNPEWPKLAGQHAGYLAKQIGDFKAAEHRNNAMMAPMVAGLNDQDILDLAAFYSGQQTAPGYAEGDEDTLALGRTIYLGGNKESGVAACTSCHGPRGHGNPWPASRPSLASTPSTPSCSSRPSKRVNAPTTLAR